MSRRDAAVSLRQMRDHAREAVDMVRGTVRADLDTDRKLNLSLVRLLEILGEAANRVSPEDQRRYPQILPPLLDELDRIASPGVDLP